MCVLYYFCGSFCCGFGSVLINLDVCLYKRILGNVLLFYFTLGRYFLFIFKICFLFSFFLSLVFLSLCCDWMCVCVCVPVRLGEERRWRRRQTVGGRDTSVWGVNTEVHDVTRVNSPAHAPMRDKPEQMRETCGKHQNRDIYLLKSTGCCVFGLLGSF